MLDGSPPLAALQEQQQLLQWLHCHGLGSWTMECGQFPQCLFLSCLLFSAEPNKHILVSCVSLDALHSYQLQLVSTLMLLFLWYLMHVDTEL